MKNKHILYTNDDLNVPECLKDRNGDIVLSQCKICGKAEAELSELCLPKDTIILNWWNSLSKNQQYELCLKQDNVDNLLVQRELSSLTPSEIKMIWEKEFQNDI